jgi:autotransporter-associated beta strand protein
MSGVLFVAFAALGCELLCAGNVNGSQPNIVMIVSDDVGYNELGFSSALNNGNTVFQTPNLDALAQQSVVGSRFYSSDSICAPSRAGLLTGQYQQRYGFEQNTPSGNAPVADYGSVGLSADQTTIAQRLKGLGYSTGAIGKWHLGYVDGLNLPEAKGFDEFYGFWGGDRQYFQSGYEAHVMRRGTSDIEATWQSEGDPSNYDPVKGRYATDAFGEESVDFINRHSTDGKPFFLYVAFNAEHTPYDAKQADLDHFADIEDPTKRVQAAIVYAMDRAIGNVVNSLHTNGIDQNTIVAFTNDNGGVETLNDNSPYSRGKATMSEGGIREPFTYKAPGMQPGIYHGPATTLDLAPTFLSAAGGDPSHVPTDGYNLAPLLSGSQIADPHQAIVWRSFSNWAVSKGDWKIITSSASPPRHSLFNLASDPQEQADVSTQHPEIVSDLLRELTLWEAQMQKPRWGAGNQNQFDIFVFRGGQVAASQWGDADAWQQAGTPRVVTLHPGDSYANATLEFPVNDDGNFTATNDMTRMSGQAFMLNQLRLTGNFQGGTDRRGTIDGHELLLVKSLDGHLPQLRLDAVATGTSAQFTYKVTNQLQLLDNLEITGDGTQNFVINGGVSDYSQPCDVTKSGTSEVILAGNNTFKGTLRINGGKLGVRGGGATVTGAAAIVIGADGELTLDGGTIDVPLLDNSAGGVFHFEGGSLRADQIIGNVFNDGASLSAAQITGNLDNHGGTLASGPALSQKRIHGHFGQTKGILQLGIGGSMIGDSDQLTIDGVASLGGTLAIRPAAGFVPSVGQSFEFLTAAGGINGTFDDVLFPTFAGIQWHVVYGPGSVVLMIDSAATAGLTGDYNGDGLVNAADYTVWRDTLGSTTRLAADGNGNGRVDADDYAIWKMHFGATSPNAGAGSSSVSAVPEPCGLRLLLVGVVLLRCRKLRIAAL